VLQQLVAAPTQLRGSQQCACWLLRQCCWPWPPLPMQPWKHPALECFSAAGFQTSTQTTRLLTVSAGPQMHPASRSQTPAAHAASAPCIAASEPLRSRGAQDSIVSNCVWRARRFNAGIFHPDLANVLPVGGHLCGTQLLQGKRRANAGQMQGKAWAEVRCGSRGLLHAAAHVPMHSTASSLLPPTPSMDAARWGVQCDWARRSHRPRTLGGASHPVWHHPLHGWRQPAPWVPEQLPPLHKQHAGSPVHAGALWALRWACLRTRAG